ncbi:MAG: beta-propeller domain-containing protein [Myxococcales bacterium]|nr:MAG: beta-propeller domain-containing protein [Myxococcales bacterium]
MKKRDVLQSPNSRHGVPCYLNQCLFMVLAFLLLALCACSHSYEDNYSFAKGSLRSIEDCDALGAAVKARLWEKIKESINDNEKALLDAIDSGFKYYGLCYTGPNYEDGYGSADAGVASTAAQDTAPRPLSADEYSSTNNQVAGVDEADFIKNDGTFIYVLAGNILQILQGWPATDFNVVSETTIEAMPQKLFVTDTRAVVLASPEPSCDGQNIDYNNYGAPSDYNPYYSSSGFELFVYDIENRKAPKLLERIEHSGNFVDSRRIANDIHVVLSDASSMLSDIDYYPASLAEAYCDDADQVSREDVQVAFERLRRRMHARVYSLVLDEHIPHGTVYRYDGGQQDEGQPLNASCQGFYEAPVDSGNDYLSVLSLALDKENAVASTTIVGGEGEVYSSSESLYVASVYYEQSDSVALAGTVQSPGYYPGFSGSESTLVHKLALSSGAKPAEYRGSGNVPGRVLNQFSMDEHNGFLRIATTQGYVGSGGDSSNGLYVLEEGADATGKVALNVTGSIDGLAKTEDIRSVRFDGDRGFVVTFKKPILCIPLI